MVTIGGRAHSIKEIHEVGNFHYPFMEISIEDPETIREQMNELNELKEQYGIYYLAHYPNEGNPFDTKQLENNFVPRMFELIELSVPLSIHKGTMHFLMDTRWLNPEIISKKIELLKKITDFAAERGVVICLENLTERHDSFSPVFESIDNLRMTLDIGHGELLSEENTSHGFIEYLFDRIAHMHVHDNMGGNSVKDDLHLSLGKGRVDYPVIFNKLNGKGYNSTITMEVKPHEMAESMKEIKLYI